MSTYSLQATNDPHGILMLVELAFNGQAPVRVVSDTRNWTVAGQEYIALPVRVRLPRQDGGENPLAELQIDNVGRGFTELLESLVKFTESGGRKIDAWTAQHRCALVSFDGPSDSPQAFANANTLAELQQLEAL